MNGYGTTSELFHFVPSITLGALTTLTFVATNTIGTVFGGNRQLIGGATAAILTVSTAVYASGLWTVYAGALWIEPLFSSVLNAMYVYLGALGTSAIFSAEDSSTDGRRRFLDSWLQRRRYERLL